MKKLLLSIAAVLLPIMASADAVEIDGINYNLLKKAKQAEVVSALSISSLTPLYSGDIVIPESVRYDNNDYSVTSIGNRDFFDCESLTSITIPSSVKSIGIHAFEYCSSLTSVTIPSSVMVIDEYALSGCRELTDVYCYAEQVPKTSYYSFIGSYIEYCTLHVPTASISAYQAVEPWKNFESIVGLGGSQSDNPTQKCATPTINYENGEISFGCETVGVEYVSEVTAPDARKYSGDKISLTNTIKVSVYATKAGYENSDVATEEFDVSAGTEFTGIPGDLNGDCELNAADVVRLVNTILEK